MSRDIVARYWNLNRPTDTGFNENPDPIHLDTLPEPILETVGEHCVIRQGDQKVVLTVDQVVRAESYLKHWVREHWVSPK